jgi:hypothetical protein
VDLLSILKRAKDRASTTPTAESMAVVGKRLPLEVLQILQAKRPGGALSGLVQEGYKVNSTLASLHQKKDKTKRVLGLLNQQLMETRGDLDDTVLECSAFLHEKEIEMNTIADVLLGLGRDMGLVQAQYGAAMAAKQEAKEGVDLKQAELIKERRTCQSIRSTMQVELKVAQKDADMMSQMVKVVHKECPKGTLMIQACTTMHGKIVQLQTNNSAIEQSLTQLPAQNQQEYQAALRNALTSSDAMAFTQTSHSSTSMKSMKARGLLGKVAPDGPTSDVPSKKSLGERCPIGDKPSCARMVDRMGGMHGSLIDVLADKRADLNRHDQECRETAKQINAELAAFNKDLSDAAMILSEATARLSTLRQEMGAKEREKHDLLHAAAVKRSQCEMEVERLESELCALTQLRQEAYRRLKKKDIIIQDCEVDNWVYGPCSVTCAGQDGTPGSQTVTREVMQPRGDIKTDEGYFGTKCPKLKMVRSCSSMPCPIDCQMASWASWSRCSKGCGGGVRTRHRDIAQMNYFGGRECDMTDAEEICNADPCDQDCQLGDWTGWGVCSRQCKWRDYVPPGRRYSHRHVIQQAMGEGQCAKRNAKERLKSETCNDFVCPKTGKCVAAQDLVLVLDGSGSVLDRSRPGRNFKMIKNFAKGMISMSILMGEKEVSGKDAVDVGMRYGIVTYGTDPKLVTPLMQERADLLKRIEDAKFPSGETATGEALVAASRVLKFSSADRKGTVLLVTDALPKSRAAALAGAEKVKDAGAQLIVVAVREAIEVTDELCAMASPPCADNLLLVDSWSNLGEQLPRFLVAACPHIASFDAPPSEPISLP